MSVCWTDDEYRSCFETDFSLLCPLLGLRRSNRYQINQILRNRDFGISTSFTSFWVSLVGELAPLSLVFLVLAVPLDLQCLFSGRYHFHDLKSLKQSQVLSRGLSSAQAPIRAQRTSPNTSTLNTSGFPQKFPHWSHSTLRGLFLRISRRSVMGAKPSTKKSHSLRLLRQLLKKNLRLKNKSKID